MNSYELSRNFCDWAFEHPDKIKPIHYAIYFFAIEHCNRLGWKDKFGLPSQMVMEAVGVKNWKTYSAGLNDLVEYGFIEIIEISKNQYSSNIVAIVKNTKAHTKAPTKALDKALQKHSTKHSQSIVSIDKQINKEQITIDYLALLEYLNKTFDRKFKLISDKVKKQFAARFKDGYTKEDIITAINNCKQNKFHVENNYQYCTPEFFSKSSTLEKYSDVTKQEKKIEAFHPIIFD